ncbi:MAG: transposase [Proteobacteria bacterium]|nr:transposase [Pseudomonadota bacterium]
MAQKRLFTGPPVASIEIVIAVYPAALLTLYQGIAHSFPALYAVFSRQVFLAFIVMITGLCVLANKPTARAIASILGVVSHDALTRLLTHTCWNASLLMGALVNQVLLVSGGTTLPSYLILDDVVIPKPFARWIAGAYWDWDHVEERSVFCHRLVIIIWTNGVLVIPVAFALWHKKHSAYFLSSKASFTRKEYAAFITQFPKMRPLLDSFVITTDETVELDLSVLAAWQKALIGKQAWAVIATHAVNQHRYRTKNEIARCLIYRVVRKGVRGEYITFDSWYASKKNLNFLTRLGLVYYTALPCSRKVHSTFRVSSSSVVSDTPQSVSALAATYSTRDYIPYPQGHLRALALRVNLSGLHFMTTLVIITRQDWCQFLKRALPADHPIHQKKSKDPNTYLLTNNVVCPTYRIIVRYRSRWTIEVMFRDLKQHLGLGACQHRSLEAITRHIALAMFAYVCLQLVRQDISSSATHQSVTMTIGDVKKHLQSHVLMPLAEMGTPGMIMGVQRPMPRDIFEQLIDPATSTVISHSGIRKLSSPDIKEFDKNA